MDKKFCRSDYKYGFVSEFESDVFAKGLSRATVIEISKRKKEPPFLLAFRLQAFEKLKKMAQPKWADLKMESIDLQDISYYAEPRVARKKEGFSPEVVKTLKQLDILEKEEGRVALDFVLDSVSVGTSLQEKLKESGVVLCSFSEAVQKYPDLVEKYLGSVVPVGDNFFATLNSAVFSDGSFVYVPRGVACPLELSTYFRINTQEIGQFERTLIIAEEGASLSYLEGCSAPAFSKSQLHAAVVELVALDEATIKYSTVQNWYSGDPKNGRGGIYNLVTKRALASGRKARIFWAQVEIGSAITWKYPSCILKGEESSGEFYSVAITTGRMQADTGTKMIHLGKKSRSLILSKGIAAGFSSNAYRGLVKILPQAAGSRSYTQCDSLLSGKNCTAATFPTVEVKNSSSVVSHEASTSKLNAEELFYLCSRGLRKEEAIALVVSGFCREVIKKLPFEFALEAEELLTMELEKAIG
ncbi:MAG: Fe-S cluster assembly protein SufB [Parachlamydiales bacterium]|jgi:Fe-S cluster assembly protein SufB